MIRAFASIARKPAIEGGCPIMNTAIEADDTHPELRDRARDVDDAVAPPRSAASSRTARPPARSRADIDPYALASLHHRRRSKAG